MATKFFNPTDHFALATGANAKWECNSSNSSTTKDRAQALKGSGDELASTQYNTKTSVSVTYVAKDAAAAIPKFGQIANGFHIDTVSVTYSNTGYATMTVTGHKHGASDHPACKLYTGSLATVGTLFGCPTTCPACTLPATTGVRSMTWSLQGNHIDELGTAGEVIGSENYDGNETVQVELCDTAAITQITSGWQASSTGNNEGNTAAETTNAAFEKHIQGSAPTV